MAAKSAAAKEKETDRTETRPEPADGRGEKYDVHFFHAWCKQCGLCMAFCPRKIIKADKNGHPQIIDADRCSGCRFCEMHCPDFAISVDTRVPKRRKTDE